MPIPHTTSVPHCCIMVRCSPVLIKGEIKNLLVTQPLVWNGSDPDVELFLDYENCCLTDDFVKQFINTKAGQLVTQLDC